MAREARKKGPGRPAVGSSREVRRRLLDAARATCIEVGFDAATTKRIAARAGVNPAMINYYFGTKEGLGREMMRDALSPLGAQLDRASRGMKEISTEDFLRMYMRAIAANPWLPRLIVREVLPVNGRFREIFLNEFVSRAAELLERLVRDEMCADRLRSDIEKKLTMLSLISLAVFPFLAAPVVEPALNLKLSDKKVIDALIDHTVVALRSGLAAGVEA